MSEQALVSSSGWYRALTLAERIAAARSLPRAAEDVEVDADLARRRLQRWRSQPPFPAGGYFEKRLAMDGLSEADLLSLLGEPSAAVPARCSDAPAWLAKIARAFSRPPTATAVPLSETPHGEGLSAFLDASQPLVDQAREQLRGGVRELSALGVSLPFDPDTVEEVLFAPLAPRLSDIMGRTMALELNVARLEGVLEGDTPEARFQSFIQRIRRREHAIALLGEYPVLARQLIVSLDHWVASMLEFLRRLTTDWDAIRAAFSPEDDPGVLVQLDAGLGDQHQGGRTVMLARFGSGFRLVYKPRPLAVGVRFQHLLAWLNEHGDHPPFRSLGILDRGAHGWVEFVAADGCTSPAEVRRFYERQGAYLALLYVLEATDFHQENLIAAGEHPVLVDLEALFHPRVGGMDLKLADDPAGSTINYSVLRVGLLPERVWAGDGTAGVDISGLGSPAGQLTPYGAPRWEGAGTDELRLRQRQVTLGEGQNRPKLNGVAINALGYTVDIVAGFTKMYRLLLTHRVDLLADDGPLARFGDAEVRVVTRPTALYDLLLSASFHPDVLRDALDRDCLFDRLWHSAEQCPWLIRVIPAEREDLWKGDIPLFTTRPNSRDLWSSAGQRIAGFFDESGMALVRNRLQRLGEDDLAQQLWFVRASLATLAEGEEQEEGAGHASAESRVEPAPPEATTTASACHTGPAAGGTNASRVDAGAPAPPAVPPATAKAAFSRQPQPGLDHDRLLLAAGAVGDRLAALALRGEHDVSWIGLTLDELGNRILAPLETDLYDGLPGVTLFLAYLGAVVGEERYTGLARAALTTLRRQVERGRSSLASIGAFSGWGGVIYALTHLGVLWREPALLGKAEAAVALLPPLIEKDDRFDMIGGAAGCIGSLVGLHRCAPSEATLAVAIQCGERLIACAQPMEHGIGWVVPGIGPKPLAGFSHGAAGIAWALMELAALSGQERFRTSALAAIAYERSLFSPEARNWPDLRPPTRGNAADASEPRFMVAWCHGAPGIGLARLASLRHHDDAATRTEIAAALRTTVAEGIRLNHGLCHGSLGNLELLLQASETFDVEWEEHLERMAALVLESIGRHGWLCANPLHVESPGLMTGLAGIGYQLLRLAEPRCVPSVLALAPSLEFVREQSPTHEVSVDGRSVDQ